MTMVDTLLYMFSVVTLSFIGQILKACKDCKAGSDALLATVGLAVLLESIAGIKITIKL